MPKKSEYLLCWSHRSLRVCELRAEARDRRDWVNVGELLDQCGDKDGPATTSVVPPMGGQGDMRCHQWDTDHVTMLDKTSHTVSPGLSLLTS